MPSASFFGRQEISEEIFQALTDPQARANKAASLLVEGPAGRGKSCLLDHILRRLRGLEDPPIVYFCSIKADVQPPTPQWFPLIARLCLAINRHAPPTGWGPDDWPFNKIGPDDNEQALTEKLGEFDVSSMIGAIIPALRRLKRGCILIVDGLEETELGLLREFEREVVEPLFSYEGMRILASRRVDSQQFSWSRFTIRAQTKPIALPRFDQEPAHSSRPETRQIDQILADNEVADEQLSAIRDQIMASIPAYTWGNPLANRLLIEAALRRSPHSLTGDDIGAVLRQIIAPPRPLSPPNQSWDSDMILDMLLQIARRFPTIDQGAPRREIAALLNLENRQRDALLGYLQECGVGHFRHDALYPIHTEFVQLLQSL
ncbi:ATP-binding protein [Chloroflexales bacterium ZM16-3]|nr:ATP-binding protein [Chloroflexales bacterium ZM16-3]